jgi:hypothetical protein
VPATSTSSSTPPTSVPGASIPTPNITRPPRPTVPPTEPRTVPTRAPRCYTNPRTSSTVCR